MAAEPELQHPQRHLDDRRLPATRAARQLARHATSSSMPPSLCGSLAFDSRGRHRQRLSLAARRRRRRGSSTRRRSRSIAAYTLPDAPDPPGTPEYQNFTGGGYFFLDHKDRIWVPTKTDHIFVLGQAPDGDAPRRSSATTTSPRCSMRRPSGSPRRCRTSTA